MSNSKTIVITSMYANPIHPGHIECLEKAKALGDYLIVIVNNDKQQLLKTGSIYQKQDFRLKIIESLKPVDEAFLSIDSDSSVCKSITEVYALHEYFENNSRKSNDFIFAKGGDRFADNIPEKQICEQLGIKIVDGLGIKTHNSTQYRKQSLSKSVFEI